MMIRSAVVAVSWGLFSVAPVSSGFLPPQYLPIIGGGGGTGYTRSCGAGKVLTGFTYRSGILIDAIGVLCRPVSSTGTLGPQSATGNLAGGTGGTSKNSGCETGKVVTVLKVYFGSYVNEMSFWCQAWNPSTKKFEGEKFLHSVGPRSLPDHTGQGSCEAPTQPGNGIRGRAANVVDAIGMICDEP